MKIKEKTVQPQFEAEISRVLHLVHLLIYPLAIATASSGISVPVKAFPQDHDIMENKSLLRIILGGRSHIKRVEPAALRISSSANAAHIDHLLLENR